MSDPQQALALGIPSSSTLETEEQEPLPPRRRGFRPSMVGGRLSVAQLITLLAIAAIGLAFVIVLADSAGAASPPPPPPLDDNHVVSRNGAVAADHGTCSQMGVDRLKDGGNAVDAAVTTALCLGVVRPFSSGLGGGGFMLVSLANGTDAVIDAREEAPAAATERMYVGTPEAALTGGLAVAVPSELQGLRMAWERYGAAPWRDNVLPVAALAEGGFAVDAEVADAIAFSADKLRQFEAAAALFLPGGEPPEAGATMSNPKLAATLRAVADDPLALSRGLPASQNPGLAPPSRAARHEPAWRLRGSGLLPRQFSPPQLASGPPPSTDRPAGRAAGGRAPHRCSRPDRSATTTW